MLDLWAPIARASRWTDPEAFQPERFVDWPGDAFGFVTQGGGDPAQGHRCPRAAGDRTAQARATYADSGDGLCSAGAGPADRPVADAGETGKRAADQRCEAAGVLIPSRRHVIIRRARPATRTQWSISSRRWDSSTGSHVTVHAGLSSTFAVLAEYMRGERDHRVRGRALCASHSRSWCVARNRRAPASHNHQHRVVWLEL